MRTPIRMERERIERTQDRDSHHFASSVATSYSVAMRRKPRLAPDVPGMCLFVVGERKVIDVAPALFRLRCDDADNGLVDNKGTMTVMIQ
jgi:hypothetical protein